MRGTPRKRQPRSSSTPPFPPHCSTVPATGCALALVLLVHRECLREVIKLAETSRAGSVLHSCASSSRQVQTVGFSLMKTSALPLSYTADDDGVPTSRRVRAPRQQQATEESRTPRSPPQLRVLAPVVAKSGFVPSAENQTRIFPVFQALFQ